MTDWRERCAELADRLDDALTYTVQSDTERSMRQLIARTRAELAQPAPEGPTDGEIEEAAKLIYASMRFAVPDYYITCDWVERGNSLVQDEARRTARAILARFARPAIKPVPGEVGELVAWMEHYRDEMHQIFNDCEDVTMFTRAATLLQQLQPTPH